MTAIRSALGNLLRVPSFSSVKPDLENTKTSGLTKYNKLDEDATERFLQIERVCAELVASSSPRSVHSSPNVSFHGYEVDHKPTYIIVSNSLPYAKALGKKLKKSGILGRGRGEFQVVCYSETSFSEELPKPSTKTSTEDLPRDFTTTLQGACSSVDTYIETHRRNRSLEDREMQQVLLRLKIEKQRLVLWGDVVSLADSPQASPVLRGSDEYTMSILIRIRDLHLVPKTRSDIFHKRQIGANVPMSGADTHSGTFTLNEPLQATIKANEMKLRNLIDVLYQQQPSAPLANAMACALPSYVLPTLEYPEVGLLQNIEGLRSSLLVKCARLLIKCKLHSEEAGSGDTYVRDGYSEADDTMLPKLEWSTTSYGAVKLLVSISSLALPREFCFPRLYGVVDNRTGWDMVFAGFEGATDRWHDGYKICSLASLISEAKSDGSDRRPSPTRADIYKLAYRLSLALSLLHGADYDLQDFRSDEVMLLFSKGTGGVRGILKLSYPFFHPESFFARRRRKSEVFGSLGIVLLEIGHWKHINEDEERLLREENEAQWKAHGEWLDPEYLLTARALVSLTKETTDHEVARAMMAKVLVPLAGLVSRNT
ncbi:hypothetical protein B0I35DRAFT_424479 [Stachybotrys elegans]|uniref:DUF7580 domain-containing protein n=1 Tax=Stachybotrys elegans TaxID=80388 RepID=A0A8K0T2S1_9HYPO|nr:hypothetical protein B0I35DRAFT_424479 [Stachybotrys elegans]